jgi:hypothetical protein|tara:strand:+ start:3787 stop:4800 length:1014 start_codon:yes stop_codon:yes gene_type:complete
LNNTPKKQHFVPQFLLKNFVQEKADRMYVFDKKKNHSFASNVKDIGHENNFYKDNVSDLGNKLEFKLSELEACASPIIGKIIEQKSVKNLDDSEISALCLFASVQMLRTNDTRELIQSFNDILNERLNDFVHNQEHRSSKFIEQSSEELKSSSIQILNSQASELALKFIDKRISLLQAPKGNAFYISDNPIVKHNHFPREGRGNLGIALKGIEIYFPISSSLCLSFLCSETVNEMTQKVNNFKAARVLGLAPDIDMSEPIRMVENFEKNATRILNDQNMDFCNSLQVIHSTRFIYSGKGSFLLAKDMLKTHPEISSQRKIVDASTRTARGQKLIKGQ